MSFSNDSLADALVLEARELSGYRAAALLTAAQIVHTFPTPITSADQLRGTKGIGSGTLRRLHELLTTGAITPSPLPEGASRSPDVYDFTQIKFFGAAKQRELVAQGITTLEELEARASTLDLTPNQRAGLIYREDLAERIPRNEVRAIGTEVIRVAEKYGMVATLAGSYRRGLSTSGDVDVLITGPQNQLAKLVQRLKATLIEYIFSLGEKKFMGVAVSPETGTYRSLDIRYVPPEVWGAALLFATGPVGLNVHQRQLAIDRGLKLSEYGLTEVATGEALPTQTEEEIFAALQMPYLTPAEREAQFGSL